LPARTNGKERGSFKDRTIVLFSILKNSRSVITGLSRAV
jgi:hypothetical protein